jgi:asparagine synthase (glutamine-hydrolysing)
MSGIAGVINFDGAPVQPGLVETMISAMSYRGPDASDYWVKESMALGHCMLRTTPESLEEVQPLVSEDQSLVLVMDGRVDNREEIRRDLIGRGAVLRSQTDAELVLRAYEVWGEDSPDRLVGDFAYAIWDKAGQKLFCARDVMGVRPFYYFAGDGFFLFSSELHALFKDGRLAKQPNLGMVAEYLSAQLVTRDETLFEGIRRLPPGHMLVAQKGRLKVTRYWHPDLLSVLSYRSEQDYVDQLVEILKSALLSKMRSNGRLGVRMSGGLDSTTIYGMAQTLLRTGEMGAASVKTYSTVFPGRACDESEYIREVNDFWGTEGVLVNYWVAPPMHYIEQARHYLICPDSPNGAMNNPLKERAHDDGVRVVLTGAGGDEWFWGRAGLYADLLKSMQFRELARFWKADKSDFRQKARTFLRHGLWPLLPRSLQSPIQNVFRKQRDYSWLTKELLQSSSLEDRINTLPFGKTEFATFDQEEVFRTGNNAWMAANAEIEDLTSSRLGIEQRHPLWDRRIIEFALAIPGTMRSNPPYEKYILRKAAVGLLPEDVRLRQDKTIFDAIFPEALKEQGGESRMADLALAEIGWVEREKALAMARTVLSAHADTGSWQRYIWPAWMVYSMDIWLRESGLP